MDVTIYSTGCPKCNVLKKKLDISKIKYNLVSDVDVMTSKGFLSAPMLEVDGKVMDFKQAIEWLSNI